MFVSEDLEPGGWSGWQELEIEAVPDVLEQNVHDAPAVVNSDDELDATLSGAHSAPIMCVSTMPSHSTFWPPVE